MRQWFKLPRDQRRELRLAYRDAGYSYMSGIKDYETSLTKMSEGGNINPIEGDAISLVLMARNQNLDMVKRASQPGPYPTQWNPDLSHSTHQMAYGEDDSGQSWMFPTIFNNKNEAIPVPNNYAEYISSQGYKNVAHKLPKLLGGGNLPQATGGIDTKRANLDRLFLSNDLADTRQNRQNASLPPAQQLPSWNPNTADGSWPSYRPPATIQQGSGDAIPPPPVPWTQRQEQLAKEAEEYNRYGSVVKRNIQRGASNVGKVATEMILPAAATAATLGMAPAISTGAGLAAPTIAQTLGVLGKSALAGIAADHMYHGYMGAPRPSEMLNINNPIGAFAADMVSPGTFVAPWSAGTQLPIRTGTRATSRVVGNNVDNVFRQNVDIPSISSPKPVSTKPWQIEELPGLHLKSTMSDGAISKIIEPKTGLINVEQALNTISKEAGGAEKVKLIREALGNKIPQKMDYNQFRKTVNEKLIPLEHTIGGGNPNYGIRQIGYYPPDYPIGFDATGHIPAKETYSLKLSNKNKFGRGSSAHGNPEETLGHVHLLIDAKTPRTLNVTQLQSDAFQGTHNIMAKTKEDALFRLKTAERFEPIDALYLTPEQKAMRKVEIENFSQKQLLAKEHQSRYIQETIDHAAKRGDIDNIRIPTSETAAKVQGFHVDRSSQITQIKDAISNPNKYYDKDKRFFMVEGIPGSSKKEMSDFIKQLNNQLEVYKNEFYSSTAQTILKKYQDMPKELKKLGIETKTVTDAKGNTWYEFDIPKSFKQGKGEIKAFSVLPPGVLIGASALKDD